MADVATAVRQHLLGVSGVTALVGSGTAARFWPDEPPQSYSVKRDGAGITYDKISTTHDHMINGLAGIARCRIEYTTYATTRSGANAVAEAVRMSGIVGFMGLTNGVYINSVMLERGEETEDQFPTDGNQEHRYLTVFDLLVCYQEEVP